MSWVKWVHCQSSGPWTKPPSEGQPWCSLFRSLVIYQLQKEDRSPVQSNMVLTLRCAPAVSGASAVQGFLSDVHGMSLCRAIVHMRVQVWAVAFVCGCVKKWLIDRGVHLHKPECSRSRSRLLIKSTKVKLEKHHFIQKRLVMIKCVSVFHCFKTDVSGMLRSTAGCLSDSSC